MRVTYELLHLLISFLLINTLFSQQISLEYDEYGNRNKVVSDTECSLLCLCPDDKDDWLKINLNDGGGGCPNYMCYFTVDLKVPEEYQCYSHYQATFVYEEPIVGKLTEIKSFDNLRIIDGCLASSQTMYVHLTLYRYPDDPNPCTLYKTVDCSPSICNTLYMHVVEIGSSGANCCYKFEVKSHDTNIYDPMNAIIKVYDEQGDLLIPNSNGEYCFEKGQTTRLKYKICYQGGICEENEITLYPNCELDCCELINLNMIPRGEYDDQCCWEPYLTSDYRIAYCDIEDFEVYLYDESMNPIELDQNGLFCSDIKTQKLNFEIVNMNTGESCGIKTKEIDCQVFECPSDKVLKSWLDLDVIKESSECGAGKCQVLSKISIDSKFRDLYDSYDFQYKIKDDKNELVTHEMYTGIKKSMKNIVLDFLPKCIEAGQKIQFSVKLYYNNSEDYCEVFSSEVFCEKSEIIKRPEPCTPDNLDDPWMGKGKVKVKVGDCEYHVVYTYRKTSDGFQDVQFLEVESSSGPNDPCRFNLDREKLFKQALPIAIRDITKWNIDFLPQADKEPKCVDTWRVVQNSCWAKWEYNSDPETEDGYFVMIPCESDCCVKHLRVCNYDGIITVTDLGFAGGSKFNCSTENPDIKIKIMGREIRLFSHLNCQDLNCDIYKDYYIEIPFEEDHQGEFENDFRNGEMQKRIFNEDLNKTSLTVQKFDNKLSIVINGININKYELFIYDILGKLRFHDINEYSNYSKYYSLENLENGTYTYTILANGRVYESDKFIILR